MKRWPIIAATIAGAVIGVLVVIMIIADRGFGIPPALMMVVSLTFTILCPAAYFLEWGNWAPPVLNALLYGGVAFGVAKWRSYRKIRTQLSK
jgi:hypothetical protein